MVLKLAVQMLLMTWLLALVAILVYLLVRGHPPQVASRWMSPLHFTIPVLSPFTSVVSLLQPSSPSPANDITVDGARNIFAEHKDSGHHHYCIVLLGVRMLYLLVETTQEMIVDTCSIVQWT